MRAKDFVEAVYPTARAESHTTYDGRKYWLIRRKGHVMYLAEGKTEAKAWKAAKDKILTQQQSKPS